MSFLTNQIKQKFFLAILFCFYWLIPLSQEIYLASDFVFEHFSVEPGTARNQINHLFQDSEGILWLGTNAGLEAYDGYHIEQFNDYLFDTSEFKGRGINSISEDGFGNIWSGTFNEGINIFYTQTGKIKHFDGNFLRIPERHNFTSIIPLNERQMLCSTTKLLITVTVSDDGSWLSHTLESIDIDKDEYILNLATFNDQIIVQTTNRILLIKPSKTETLLSKEGIKSIKIKENGILWFITKDTIGALNLTKNTLHWIPYEKPENINDYLDLDKDLDNNLWIGTSNGILRLKIDNYNVLDTQHIQAPNKYGIINVLVDPSNNVYFSTNGSGFFKLGWERNNYNYVSLPKSYKNEYVFRGMEDTSGLYWIGSFHGVFLYNPNKRTFVSFTGEVDVNLGDYQINDMLEDREGQVWLSTDNGIAKFDNEHQKFVFYGNNLGRSKSFTHHLEMDKNSNLWYATNSGISKFSKKDKHVEHYNFGETKSIYIDKENKLWASLLHKGLICFDIASGEPKQIMSHSKEFARFEARDIISDTLKRIWYTTENGIYVFDTKKEEIVNHLHQGNILDTNETWHLIPNSTGNFWLKQVISESICINPYTFEVVSSSPNWLKLMAKGSGFAGPNYIDKNGKAFTDGIGGFFVYKPDSLKINPRPPKVLLTSIEINGERVYQNSVGSTAYNFEKLNYSKNSITFNFKGIHSDNPDKIRYAYRLLGQNKEWIYTSTRSAINYSALVPNTYEFEVKAANKDLVWSEPTVLARFQIVPPWWKTSYAYAMYLVLFAVVFYSIYKIQLDRKLAETRAQKLKEVDDFKNRFFANITHEFRTPLTVIIGMAEKIESTAGSMIKRNANQLLKLINQLLEIGRIESNESNLKIERHDFVFFLKYTIESFSSLANDKSITMSFKANQNEIMMNFDIDKMQLVLNNLLSNAIKFTAEHGQIDIFLNRTNDSVELRIKDNGIGIPKDKLNVIFKRYYQIENARENQQGTGIGLALTHELIKLMNGKIEAENNKDGGACFIVTLPIVQSIYLQKDSEIEKEEELTNIDNEQNLILVIEDNKDIITYIKTILSDQYRIETAPDGEIGVDMAIELIPDLIVSDVMMPKMDGLQVCDALKNDFRTNHIPIILLTAKADIESKISGLKHGADTYLAKPFNPKELLVHIENLIEIRENLKQKYSSIIQDEAVSNKAVKNEFLEKIKATILDHISNDTFGINQICLEIGVSRTQFHRKLKALTGLSASIFIREIRLQKAYEMLKETSLNISEIAYSVGFTDPGYFSKLFHEKYHYAPSHLRDQ